jgi:signal peptidase I
LARVGREIIEAVVLAAVVFMLLQVTVRNFKVDGSSMDPTLEDGQYLLVNRLVYLRVELDRLAKVVPFWKAGEGSSRHAIHAPKRGEVIVFEFPDSNPNNPRKDFVKRVVGMPGETMRMFDGKVFVNEEVLDEPYLSRKDHSNASEVTLGEGEYYVLGDNRTHSNDSRSWGTVPEANIRGKVWMVYWPARGIQIINILDRIPDFG